MFAITRNQFISAATGSDVGGVPKDGYGEGQVSKCLVSGTSIVFLEVPSSDEMGKFLVFVSEWLERAYVYPSSSNLLISDGASRSEMNLKIAGIIYIHSINSINHTLDSLPFFGSLNAGYPANFQSIILVTSMWGTGAKDDSQRERQLITEYWKPLLDRGSTAVRFLNTSPSALDILSNILPRKRGGTPASSIDPRSSRRIDAHPENGQYPHVSLLAALLDASSCFAFAGSGVDAWKDAVHATLAIMNTPEVRLRLDLSTIISPEFDKGRYLKAIVAYFGILRRTLLNCYSLSPSKLRQGCLTLRSQIRCTI